VKSRQRAAVLAGALLLTTAAAPACTLVLSEYRSGRELARLPLDPARPQARVAFTHSVLGTPVEDHYAWRHDGSGWRAHLVQERFEGEGYGLPNAAGPGETLERDGAGWRLTLDRLVHPLVLPPVQGMRVSTGSRAPLALRALSHQSIELRATDCPAP
jgi:hypothetical protein